MTLRQAIKAWLLHLFHIHVWKDERENRVWDSQEAKRTGGIPVYSVMVQKCEVCGNRRKQKF